MNIQEKGELNMLLPQFEYHEPGTLSEACEFMAEFSGKAKALAGGTDLIVNMKKKLLRPEHLVCVDRVDEMKGIALSDGKIRIGAAEKVADIAASGDVARGLSALAVGANSLGSPLIRNLATIGGNLCSARPAADLPPSLIAYGATVTLRSKGGERTVAVEEMFTGPGETIMKPEELISEIVVPIPSGAYGAHYIKLGVRRVLEISIVNVAAFVRLDDDGSHIAEAKVVLGAVAPTPIRAPSAEEVVKGQQPDETLLAKAGEAAAMDAKPIDDFRASAEYRTDMVKVLTKRALRAAYEEAAKK